MQTSLWIEVTPEGEAVTVGAKAMRTEVEAMMAVEEGTMIGEAIAVDMARGAQGVIKVVGAVVIAVGVIVAAGEFLVHRLIKWGGAYDAFFVFQARGRGAWMEAERLRWTRRAKWSAGGQGGPQGGPFSLGGPDGGGEIVI
jgi:hypothetical protein